MRDTGWNWDKGLEIVVPNFLLGFALAHVVVKGTSSPDATGVLALAVILWISSTLIRRVFPKERPTELKREINGLEDNLGKLRRFTHETAEFQLKEINTIKSALQIKQMGR